MRLMLTLLFSLFLATSCKPTVQYRPIIYVDERIELMNIVFRLADVPYYQSNLITPYTSAIDDYFLQYKDHDLIKFTAELWQQYYISSDAVAGYAVLLEITDGEVDFIDNVELVFDSRWKGNDPYIFLEKLTDFYKESGFHTFFKKSKPLYQKAIDRYNSGYIETDFGWFDDYFGIKRGKENFNIIINLLDEFSYGPKAIFSDGSEKIYAIVGTYLADDTGYPEYEEASYHIVIHELIHSYTNSLIDEYSTQLEAINSIFYNYTADHLRSSGIGSSRLFLYETLVRASEIQYHKIHSTPTLWHKRLNLEHYTGFLWLGELCHLMETEYELKRDKYSDLGSFMPCIVEFLNTLSPERLSEKLASDAVSVIGSSIVCEDEKVSPQTKTLTITFDRTMFTEGDSYSVLGREIAAESNYEKISASWSENAKELTLNLDLKPNTKYSIIIHPYNFMGIDYKSMNKKFTIEFKTSAS